MKKVRDETCCLAPWVSLRIGLSGEVFACNHNSSFLLGKYPDQSLKEIWSGKRIHKLRKHLRKNDFSLGCDICAEDWHHHRNNAASFTLFRKYQPGSWPSMLDFRLSNRCNLQCIMCSGLSSSQFGNESAQEDELFGEDFMRQLDAFIPHLQTARFIGGEPFLIPEYYRIWERIIDLNPLCEIVVQTNATILNERIKDLMEKGRFQISVSIDSFQADVYETIRKNAHFADVMENLRFFARYASQRNTDMVICFCPMRMNHQEIPALFQLAAELDTYVCLNRFYYPARLAIWSLPREKIRQHREDLRHFQPAHTGPKGTSNAAFLNDYLDLMQQWEEDAGERTTTPPSAASSDAFTERLILSAGGRPGVTEKLNFMLQNTQHIQLYRYMSPALKYYGESALLEFIEQTDTLTLADDVSSVGHL